MIYSTNITTPADTQKTALKKSVIRVSKGLVYHVEIYFPPGSAGLMGVAIFDSAYQAWPSSPGEFLIGDNALLRYDDTYLKSVEPFSFDILTYNEDDTYEHDLQVRIGLVSETIFMARFLPHLSYEFYKQMLLELQKAQEEEAKKQIAEPFPWLIK